MDQAVVSLVDKDLMRKKLNKIFDIIRAHSKAILQKKASEATSIAEEIAQHSISSSKVNCLKKKAL